jgi:transcriptional regulator with XRE-family HTH domain
MRNPVRAESAQNVGMYIRKVRLEKGLKQVDVTVAIGVDEMTIVNWEKRQAFPTGRFGEVKAIYECLGISYAEMPRQLCSSQFP